MISNARSIAVASRWFPMGPIQVSQIPFESEACGVKWQHFYNEIVNKLDIVKDMELIFGQLAIHDKMKPV